jgi:CubicO group peptidase (beta-lactamase class C family)
MVRTHLKTLTMLLSCLIMSLGATDDPARQVDSIFNPLIAANEPGAAVWVIKDGRPLVQRSYGVIDINSAHKIDAQTNFRLASVTKQFTAMAIMLLVHDGKFHYEDHLTDIFPDFPAYGKTITIRNLLNHTSGLIDYEDLMAKPYGGRLPDTVPQIKDAGVLALLRQEKSTNFPPGQHWSYSNSGYAVLAMILEKASGKSYGGFLHDRICAPLGMNQTIAYEKGKNEVPNRAYGHSKTDTGWKQTDQSPTSAVLGDGGIYSSLTDLAKWDYALENHTILSANEMVPALTAVQVPDRSVLGPDNEPAEYGFGWFLDPYKNHGRMGHHGETVGFRTAIERFPDERLSVVVLCNRNDIAAQDVALKIADLFVTRH